MTALARIPLGVKKLFMQTKNGKTKNSNRKFKGFFFRLYKRAFINHDDEINLHFAVKRKGGTPQKQKI